MAKQYVASVKHIKSMLDDDTILRTLDCRLEKVARKQQGSGRLIHGPDRLVIDLGDRQIFVFGINEEGVGKYKATQYLKSGDVSGPAKYAPPDKPLSIVEYIAELAKSAGKI